MKRNFISTIKNNKETILKAAMMGVGFMIIFPITAHAANGTEQFDQIIKWIATWVGRVGLAVAFFGGIQTAFAFKNDDADTKAKGLKTLASGFMVFALSNSLSLFGI